METIEIIMYHYHVENFVMQIARGLSGDSVIPFRVPLAFFDVEYVSECLMGNLK